MADIPRYRTGASGNSTWLLDESVQGQSKSIYSCFITTKDGGNALFGKEIIISEVTPKIGTIV